MESFIYVLRDPETNQVRYVGWTVNLEKRLVWHLRDKKRTHKYYWIALLKERGLKPIIELVYTVKDGECWQDVERKWIAYYRNIGENLTNATDGGEGARKGNQNAKGTIRTKEFKQSQSVRMRGDNNPMRKGHHVSPNKGKPMSEEQKLKISIARTGKKYGPRIKETGRKISASLFRFYREKRLRG